MPVPSLHLRALLDGGAQHGPDARSGFQSSAPSPSNASGAVANASSSQEGQGVQPSTSRSAQRQTPNPQPGAAGPLKDAKGVPGRSNLAAPGDGPDAGQASDGPPPPSNSGGPGNDGSSSGGDAGNGTDDPPPPTSQIPPPVTSTSSSRSSTSKPTSTPTRPASTSPRTSLPSPTPNAPDPGGGGSSGPPQANPGSLPPSPSSSDQAPSPPTSSSTLSSGKGDVSQGTTNVSDKPQTDHVYPQHHDENGTHTQEDGFKAHSGDDNGGNGSGSGSDYHHADPGTTGSASDSLSSGSGGPPPDPSTGLPGSANTDHKRGGMPAAGVAVLVIALVLLVVAGTVFFLRRRKKRHGKPAPQFVFVGQSHYQDLDEPKEKLSPLPERGLSAKLRSSVRRTRAPRWSGYSNGMLHIPRSSAEMSEGSFVIGDAASDRSSRISEASASSFTPTVSTGVQFAAPSPPPTARPLKFSEDDPFADPCNPFLDPYCTRAPSPKLSL